MPEVKARVQVVQEEPVAKAVVPGARAAKAAGGNDGWYLNVEQEPVRRPDQAA